MDYNQRIVIGIMGPGSNATQDEIDNAYNLGRLIAQQPGWILLTGGVNTGVMNAAPKGAKEENQNCTTMAILPHRGEPERTSQYLDIKIPTGTGEGRNNLNVTTSDFVVACCNNLGSSPGKSSEVIFAIKHHKPFIGLCYNDVKKKNRRSYFKLLNMFLNHRHQYQKVVDTPEEVIQLIQKWINKKAKEKRISETK